MEHNEPERQPTAFPPVMEYYREFYRLKDTELEYDTAFEAALTLIDSLNLDEPIQDSLDQKVLPELYRTPIDQERALLELCFMPLETLGPKLEATSRPASEIEEWYTHTLVSIPTVMRSFYSNSMNRPPTDDDSDEMDRKMLAVKVRISHFVNDALDVPDFNEAAYQTDLVARRQKDLAVASALHKVRLLSVSRMHQHRESYETAFSAYIRSSIPDDLSQL